MTSCEVKSIAELFALQVKKQPGAAAVNFDRRQISYRELSQKADRIAGDDRCPAPVRASAPAQPLASPLPLTSSLI